MKYLISIIISIMSINHAYASGFISTLNSGNGQAGGYVCAGMTPQFKFNYTPDPWLIAGSEVFQWSITNGGSATLIPGNSSIISFPLFPSTPEACSGNVWQIIFCPSLPRHPEIRCVYSYDVTEIDTNGNIIIVHKSEGDYDKLEVEPSKLRTNGNIDLLGETFIPLCSQNTYTYELVTDCDFCTEESKTKWEIPSQWVIVDGGNGHDYIEVLPHSQSSGDIKCKIGTKCKDNAGELKITVQRCTPTINLNNINGSVVETFLAKQSITIANSIIETNLLGVPQILQDKKFKAGSFIKILPETRITPIGNKFVRFRIGECNDCNGNKRQVDTAEIVLKEDNLPEIIISPNPTSDFLNIDNIDYDNLSSISIANVTGRQFKFDVLGITENSFKVNVSNFNSDLYIISLTNKNSKETVRMKFIKQ